MTRRPVRLEDVAREAGVSIATVSRALNNSTAVSAETRRQVWAIARELDYVFRPHMPAVQAEGGGAITLAIPLPQGREGRLLDPFLMELIAGIAEAARENGCDLHLSHAVPRTKEDLLEQIAPTRRGGTIFLGQSTLHAAMNALASEGHRFVVWGAELRGQRYGSVGSDNHRGGRRATAHLLRLGRRRIAFLGDTAVTEARQRYEGYVAALEEADLPVDPALFCPTGFELEAGEAAADALLSGGARFDAIVASSDIIATGAIRALIRAGRRVPVDVGVVGYDDVWLARFGSPRLTTIRQDLTRAGRLLVAKLMSEATAAEIASERLTTDLVVRESCGA